MKTVFAQTMIEVVYSHFCKLIRIVGPKGEFVSEFPVDLTNERPFDPHNIPLNQEVIPLETDIRNSDMITALTPNFWTCNCKKKYVRHIGDCMCAECGTHINSSTMRLPMLTIMEEPSWAKDVDKTVH